jgi:hypothetical protein
MAGEGGSHVRMFISLKGNLWSTKKLRMLTAEDAMLAMGMPVSAEQAKMLGLQFPIFTTDSTHATLRGMAGTSPLQDIVVKGGCTVMISTLRNQFPDLSPGGVIRSITCNR